MSNSNTNAKTAPALQLASLFLALVFTGPGFATSALGQQLASHVWSGGGGIVAGDQFVLLGTLGEPIVGQSSNAGTFSAGYWNRVVKNSVATSVEQLDESAIPASPVLAQNYPNPFSGQTELEYGLTEATYVRLEVFDLTGRHIQTLVDGQRPAGRHRVSFDSGSLASGLYIYRIEAGSFIDAHTMLLIR